MTNDPPGQTQQPTADRSRSATSTASAGPSPIVIGAIVVALLIGGFYLAGRIINIDEPPEKTSPTTVTNKQPASDSYISPAGYLEAGVTLYDKETKQPWGTIAAVPDSVQIEVLRINNMALGDDGKRGIPALYDRAYITSNFVIKSEKRSR
jgi:hypothetical protein